MTALPARILKWVTIIIASCVLLLFLAGTTVSHYASRQLSEKLTSSGGSLGSLRVNIFTGSITLEKLSVEFRGDSVQSTKSGLTLPRAVFSNISAYNYLVHKRLQIGDVIITNADLIIDKNHHSNDSAWFDQLSLSGIVIERLLIKNATITVTNNTHLLWTANINATLDDIASVNTKDITELQNYTIEEVEVAIKNLVVRGENGLYKTQVKSIYLNTAAETLEVDSILLIPQHPKYKFARAAGKQTDRINTFIKKIQVNGFSPSRLHDSVFVASKVQISSAEVYSFRDKRMPFREKENKPLPMQALKKLNFAIEIDSIVVDKAKITYEEFPAEGFESGKVIFENVNAIFKNVNNRSYYNNSNIATLHATAALMGKGLLEAKFTLPLKDDMPYHAEGKISNLNLAWLNPALENLAFVQIESGRLNELAFSFDYNDRFSNGQVTVNYENLKVNGLKKQKSTVINDIKTFLINTVVKNDKDLNTPAERRTGKIAFERDRKRQVFNYWWKSLYSGIKRSFVDNGTK